MRLPRHIPALLPWRVCSLVLATAACADDSTFLLEIDAGVVHTPFADLCMAYARALCSHDYACSPAGPPPQWASQAQCVERETLRCDLTSTDPGVHFDANAVARCAKEIVTCASPFPPLYSCLVPGDIPAGGPCLWSAACATQFCYRSFRDGLRETASVCGVCASNGCAQGCPGGSCVAATLEDAGVTIGCQSYAALGESCDAGNLGCSTGAWCDPGLHCSPRAALGEACGTRASGGRCVPGTYCTGAGNCAPLARLGEACGYGTTAPPCAPASDQQAVYCDDTQHCAPVVAAPYGGTCGAAISCSGGGRCIPNGYSYPGTCTPPVPDGLGPCGSDNALGTGIPCLEPALCVKGRCVYPTLAVCGG